MRTLRQHSSRAVLVALVAFLSATLVVVSPGGVAHAAEAVDYDKLTEGQWRRFLRNHGLAMNVPSSTVTGGPGLETPEEVGKGLTPRQVKRTRQKAAQRNATHKTQRVAGQSRPRVVLPQVQAPPTSAAKGGTWWKTGLRGAGNALTAAFVFDLAYSGTGWVMGTAFGIESNGFTCDLGALVREAWCGYVPHGEYLPNADVFGLVPGWVGSNFYTAPSTRYRKDGYSPFSDPVSISYSAGFVTEPVFGASGVAGRAAISASPTHADFRFPQTEDYGLYLAVQMRPFCLGSDDVVRQGVTAVAYGNGRPPSQPLREGDVSCPTNSVFERVEFWAASWSSQTGAEELIGVWYPVGHVDRPMDVAEDPYRRWQTVWHCQGPSGPPQINQATGEPWRETDEMWPDPLQPECAEGSLVYMRVDQITEGLEEPWTLYEWEQDPAVIDWEQTYPECTDGTCLLLLHKLDHETNTRLSCFQSPDPCAEWWTDPQKEANYVCTYGKHDVELDECKAYATLFDRDTRTHADPRDGEAPEDDDTWVGVPPGENPVPREIGQKDPNCPPPFDWLALFNPWWYYQGVGCAIQAAFVPSGEVVAEEVDRVGELWRTRPPGSVVTVAQPIIEGLGQGWDGGCSGGLANFGDAAGTPIVVPCEPPGEVQEFSTMKVVIGIALVVGTAFALWHMTIAAIGGNQAEGD